MSLNKKKMVREIGRRTRIRNRDVQAVIEALIEVWREELVSGGRIELENFFVMEVRISSRGQSSRTLHKNDVSYDTKRLIVRKSKHMKRLLNSTT